MSCWSRCPSLFCARSPNQVECYIVYPFACMKSSTVILERDVSVTVLGFVGNEPYCLSNGCSLCAIGAGLQQLPGH